MDRYHYRYKKVEVTLTGYNERCQWHDVATIKFDEVSEVIISDGMINIYTEFLVTSYPIDRILKIVKVDRSGFSEVPSE